MRCLKIPLLVIFLMAIIAGASYIKFNYEDVVQTMGNSISSKVIIVDPGHGGFDPGKPGINGADEKDLNLQIGLKLRDYLEQAGAIVIMTRTTDNDVDGMEGVKHKSKDMIERKKIALEGDIVVSIHQNSFSQPSVRGAQVFYSAKSNEGKTLATHIQQSIKINVDETNRREAKSNNNYYVLKAIEIPSVIVECGFLTNPEEESKLNESTYQDKIAWSIYLGIVKYFETSGQQL